MSSTSSTLSRPITHTAIAEICQRHRWSTWKKRRMVNTSQVMAITPMTTPRIGPTPVAMPMAGSTNGKMT